MNELYYRTASELANDIQTHRVSSVDIVEAFLARIDEHNPSLNAIVTLEREGARQRALEADKALARGEVWGLLHGVPITVKDSLETAGLRTTSSHKPLANYVPKQDATVVARLRQAGAVLLGKTNLPELVGDSQCNSPVFGITRNPWNLERTPGGSSGGEAAAIAAGMSPLGIGSDIGGSIRIPAHFCGVFGLKPTNQRVSIAGHIPPLPGAVNSVRYLPTNGPLARSVDDLRLCLQLIAGPDGRSTNTPPVPLGEAPLKPLDQLRFAWTDDFSGVPVSADTHAALIKLADDLANAGCHVEQANPPGFDFEMAWRTYGELFGAMVYSASPPSARFFIKTLGPLFFRDIMFGTASRSVDYNVQQFSAALDRRDQLLLTLERFLARYDAWLCPIAAVPAFPHRQAGRPNDPLDVDGQVVPGALAGLGFTTPFNLTGHPAVVVPLVQSREGLPIGVQLVGRLWGEMALLRTAEALTEVTGPFQRPPGY